MSCIFTPCDFDDPSFLRPAVSVVPLIRLHYRDIIMITAYR